MKRRIFKLSLFLLLGAIINVGLTYGLFLRLEPPLIYSMSMQSDSQLPWPAARPSDGSRMRIDSSPTFGTDRFEYQEVLELEGRPYGARVNAFYCRAGWPVRSFEGGYYVGRYVENLPDFVEDGATFLQSEWANRFWTVLALPLRPLWPGFAINTIFYAAVLWLPFAAFGVVRRRRRLKRGLCPKCGYDLRGRASENKLCPECGASASKPS